jgi:hypothetical protein
VIAILITLFLFGLPAAVLVALILLSWGYFDRRYKAKTDDPNRVSLPDPGYEPIAEVFIDPKDNKRYRVYYNRFNGDRQYVEEPM